MDDIGMYQPRILKYLKDFPPLYAFRMVAQELGGVSLAQGSPSEGPSPKVITNVALRELAWAAAQASIPSEEQTLINQLLAGMATLKNTPIEPLPLTGYPDISAYKQAQLSAANFLSHQFKTGLITQADAERHLIIDSYSRHLLNLTLKELRLSDDDNTVRQDRERNVVLTHNGYWPLVTAVVQANNYSLIHVHAPDRERLAFGDFKRALEALPPTANAVIYINDPSNPQSIMFPHQDRKDFLLDVTFYNHAQELSGKEKRVRILSDNAYWGWADPAVLQESGFPFFTKAAFDIQRETEVRVQNWLIETISLGKAFGLASMGGSIGYYGASELQSRILAAQTRDTNTPGIDKLALIAHILDTADFDQLIQRATDINRNLTYAYGALQSAIQDKGLPLIVDVEPKHGAYISVRIGPELLDRRATIKGEFFDVKTPLDLCIYLVEAHGVAITPNDQTDLPGTVRIFVDMDPDTLRRGMDKIILGLHDLMEAQRCPTAFSNSQKPSPNVK